MTKEEMKQKIDEYTIAWSLGKPEIDDASFDELVEEYVRLCGEENRPFLRMKQTDTVHSLVKTLPKVYGVTQPMREGQKTYEMWFNSKHIDPDTRIIIQPKFDGVSVAYDVKNNRYFTRGDYDNGESVDVTDLFVDRNFGKHMPKDFDEDIGVKFEAIMPIESYNSLFKEKYDTPRDAVSAIITSRDVENAKYITLIPLRIAFGFEEFIPDELQTISIVTTVASDFDTIEQFVIDKLNDGAIVAFKDDGLHYNIDGVVVSTMHEIRSNSSYQSFFNWYFDDLNTISRHHYKSTVDEVAIKILNDINRTKLVDVVWQFGDSGKITPVAIVEPVRVANNTRTVDHVTLSTFERVYSMNLKVGDTVDIMYNIVPYFLRTEHDGTIPTNVPTRCVVCGFPLDLSNLKTVRCMNPNCIGRKKGNIIRYVKAMKMMGISDATINTLYDNGLIRDIPDLYNLTVDDICSLDGFKTTSANNIINSIHSATTNVPVARWLGAFPFKDISSKKWDIILNYLCGKNDSDKNAFVIDLINNKHIDTYLSDMSMIPGIGTATLYELNSMWSEYAGMMKVVMNNTLFRNNKTTNDSTKGGITFTGFRDAKLAEELEGMGYDIVDFSSKTKYLLIPDKSYNNAKTKKAAKMGIEIIPVTEVKRLM